MAKRTNKINEREREIVNMECENLRDISKDLDELMNGDDIDFEKPIKTKRFYIHGITYMTVTDISTDTNIEMPAFCINEHLNIPVVNAPYEVALMVYRTVLAMKEQS